MNEVERLLCERLARELRADREEARRAEREALGQALPQGARRARMAECNRRFNERRRALRR